MISLNVSERANSAWERAVEALTKNGRENRGYNITDPEAVSNYDIANILSEKDQIHQIEIEPLHGAL